MKNTPLFLVYVDAEDNYHGQPWTDAAASGPMIDPETGDEMQLVAWTETEGDW